MRGYDWSRFENTCFLVTGAYGMLASYLVFFLIYLNEEFGYNIRIIVQGRSREKMKARFKNYLDKAYFIEAYFSLNEDFHLTENVDYVVHAAGISNPEFYSTNPVEVEETNVIGTYNLLSHFKDSKLKGFLFFSSGDVYGKMLTDVFEFGEDVYGVVDPLDPHSCYGESKRMAETFCSSFAREYKLPTRIARIAHTYGPTMDIENDPRVFASFVGNAVRGEDIVMYSDGSAKRPFCYIADATVAFLLILLKGEDGEAYNMGNSDNYMSVGELADMLADIVGHSIKVVRKVRVKSEYLEASFNKGNLPSEGKLLELGWKHTYSAREGFARVIEYFKSV